MAIHPTVSFAPPEQVAAATRTPPPPSSIERVEAWTVSQAADALANTSLASPTPVRPAAPAVRTPTRAPRASITLSDDSSSPPPPRKERATVHTVHGRRQLIRRDSQKSREALLKGKEGSRRRQRWENDRLLNNPYAQPPLPSDWAVQPTYPRHNVVPYFLAPLWDAQYARSSAERQQRLAAKGPATQEEAEARKVAQELKAKLKKSRGARGFLRDLEEEVRGFVASWEEKQRELEDEGAIESSSEEEDEEIVFVGRNGEMSEGRRRERQEAHLQKDKLIFQGLLDDHGAAFG